jgi:uncharacterized protein (DUF2141 family)
MLARLPILICTITIGVTGLGTSKAAHAAELVVIVKDVKSDGGEIGCALFSSEKGFPMDATGAHVVWLRASQPTVICKFDALAEGRYAVAVSHDLNGNRHTDTNILGIPIEDWGVSNNIRPFMRAPTFAEASIIISAEEIKMISVEIDH